MWSGGGGGGVAEDLVTTRKPTTTEKNQDGSQDIVVCCLRLQSEWLKTKQTSQLRHFAVTPVCPFNEKTNKADD